MSKIAVSIECRDVEQASKINVLLIRVAWADGRVNRAVLGHQPNSDMANLVEDALSNHLAHLRTLINILEEKSG